MNNPGTTSSTKKSYEDISTEKNALQENISKAYALIFTNYCTRPMQSRIKEHPDFESTIEDNPFELLKVIKTLMHDAVRAQYPYMHCNDGWTDEVAKHQAIGK